MNSFQLVHVETLDEKKEMLPLFCKTGKNGFSFKRRLLFSMPRDFHQRFPFFSCFSDSTNELVVPDAFAGIPLLFCTVPHVTVASPLRQSLPTIAEIASERASGDSNQRCRRDTQWYHFHQSQPGCGLHRTDLEEN